MPVHRYRSAPLGVHAPGRVAGVPNQPKTPNRALRITDQDWADLAAGAAAAGADRTKVITALLRWYLRRPGARLPTRPPAPPS